MLHSHASQPQTRLVGQRTDLGYVRRSDVGFGTLVGELRRAGAAVHPNITHENCEPIQQDHFFDWFTALSIAFGKETDDKDVRLYIKDAGLRPLSPREMLSLFLARPNLLLGEHLFVGLEKIWYDAGNQPAVIVGFRGADRNPYVGMAPADHDGTWPEKTTFLVTTS